MCTVEVGQTVAALTYYFLHLASEAEIVHFCLLPPGKRDAGVWSSQTVNWVFLKEANYNLACSYVTVFWSGGPPSKHQPSSSSSSLITVQCYSHCRRGNKKTILQVRNSPQVKCRVQISNDQSCFYWMLCSQDEVKQGISCRGNAWEAELAFLHERSGLHGACSLSCTPAAAFTPSITSV